MSTIDKHCDRLEKENERLKEEVKYLKRDVNQYEAACKKLVQCFRIPKDKQ